jgi:hypothetical protein
MANPDDVLQAKGFFASLFDFSFKSFITLRFIKVLYIVIIVLAGIIAFAFFATTLATGNLGSIILGLLFGAIFFFFYVILARLGLELLVVIFRIGENTSILVDQAQNRPQAGPGATGGIL